LSCGYKSANATIIRPWYANAVDVSVSHSYGGAETAGTEQDKALAERDAARAERDTALEERDDLQTELDSDNRALHKMLKEAQQRRNHALFRRDKINKEFRESTLGLGVRG
jgi:uncharacterized protein (DUF3084 family)